MVSVVIPVYNGEEYLEKCIRSVMNQSYHEIEIIVVDDGSKDHSYLICAGLEKEDSRIRLFHQTNSGVSAARNRGIENAIGEFIIFVDADDILPPYAIESLVKASDKETELVIGSSLHFSHNKKVLRTKEIDYFSQDVLRKQPLQVEKVLRLTWGKLYRNDIIICNHVRFNTDLPYLEDTLFTWKYCKYVNNIRVLDDIVYWYRLGGAATSEKYYPSINKYLQIALETYSDFYNGIQNVPKDFIQYKVTMAVLDCSMHYLKHCSKMEAFAKIKETVDMLAPYISIAGVEHNQCSENVAKAIECYNAEKLAEILYRENRIIILLKKMKKKIKSVRKKMLKMK